MDEMKREDLADRGLLVGNHNVLAKPKVEDILEKNAIPQDVSADYHPFGDGHAADKIVQAIEAAGK